MDLTLFKKIVAEARHNKDLLDSVSPNQYRSKEVLCKCLIRFVYAVYEFYIDCCRFYIGSYTF